MTSQKSRTRNLVFRLFIPLFLTVLLLIIIGLWPFKSAIFARAHSWQQLNDIVIPHMTIETPTGSGPFPVVLIIPGCEGVKPERAEPRMEWLVKQGYMAVMVDSHKGRGLDEDTVCGGHALWGAERAGDIYVALEAIRQHPKADTSNIALLGYSHGGWAIHDALSYQGDTPYALASAPPDALQSVKAAIVYYPYCGLPSRARYTYSNPTPLLIINAGEDTTVNPAECEAMADKWITRGLPVQSITYPEAGHGFDISGHKNANPTVHQQALSAVAQFLNEAFSPKAEKPAPE
ncbi:dienelactone hydrolase family protein [Endozoicomonas elysicola]|uniref:dienelactone hydrolase family protein n=1 Tax=Endozoicomonas elysicola TaxID=305900 RepID=UPI0003728BAC|nr:dienelactone hydrolase family protein [Endozoicomonas elysicola]